MSAQYRALLLLPLLLASCMETPMGVTPSNPRIEDFLTVWEEFEEFYPEFPIKGMNWEQSYGRYLPAAEAAATPDEMMLEVILPMLAELQDCHVWLSSPGKDFYYTYEPEIDENYDIEVLLYNYLYPNDFTGWSGGVGYCPPDRLPYLSINVWLEDLNMDRIDEFVGMLPQGCPGIIIDVRMNPGGNNMLCQEVAGRFAQETVLSWMARSRSGPDYDDCDYYDVSTTPAGPLQFDGTVLLLIGEYCASSTEDFICSMMNLPNVVMLGDTTIGAGCCPYWVELTNRWQFTAVSWSTRTADNQPVEWLGIAPDICVEATEEQFGQGIDPVLDYAIAMLKAR